MPGPIIFNNNFGCENGYFSDRVQFGTRITDKYSGTIKSIDTVPTCTNLTIDRFPTVQANKPFLSVLD